MAISRDKYRNINKFFYISKYNGILTPFINENNKTDKIDEFISYITKKWKSTYPYSQNITIDESICAYKDKLSIKQFIKDKHKKFGVKFFMKSSSKNGYCYDLIAYSGKSFIFDKKIGIGPTIVTKFVEVHENKNYHFCFDNYYSTPYLFLYLNSKGIDFACTFNKNG